MPEPAIEIGDKLHIITRRRFEGDDRRHFVGEVTGITGELYKVTGYVFVLDQMINEYRRLRDLRTRLFSFGQEGFIVNMIPRQLDIAMLEYRVVEKRLVMTDGVQFILDLNEFGIQR